MPRHDLGKPKKQHKPKKQPPHRKRKGSFADPDELQLRKKAEVTTASESRSPSRVPAQQSNAESCTTSNGQRQSGKSVPRLRKGVVWLAQTSISSALDQKAIAESRERADAESALTPTNCVTEYIRLVKADWFRRQVTKIRKACLVSSSTPTADNRNHHIQKKLKPATMVVERWIMRYQLAIQALAEKLGRENGSRLIRDLDPVFPQAVKVDAAGALVAGEAAKDGFFDPELADDLVRCGDTKENAAEAAKQIARLSNSLAEQLKLVRELLATTAAAQQHTKSRASRHGTSVPIGDVVVTRHKFTLDIAFVPPRLPEEVGDVSTRRDFLKINPAHYEKMRTCYRAWLKRHGEPVQRLSRNTSAEANAHSKIMHSQPGPVSSKSKKHLKKEKRRLALQQKASSDGGLTPQQTETFHRRLYCLLARYQTIQGHGFQAAVVEHAFAVLHRDLGVELECFASPLNSAFAVHCSAFRDTDACFGSIGSFFEFRPMFGSFEVNPPFEVNVMKRAVDHVNLLLDGASGALSFVLVVPVWKEADFYAAIRKSRHPARFSRH
eukprot:INCI13467.29.p1 GENE.INCI13467.29~~INCI13467.29.p1  ORF type:complete len:553 (+),score=110.10 INCI13467.29:267-1925(+)